MTRFNWNDTAKELAEHIGKYRSQVERGAVTLEFVEEDTLQRASDPPLVIGVFGNDPFWKDATARQVVEMIRTKLGDFEADELGFAISDEGNTWSLLVGADKDRYQTKIARTLQKELLHRSLEEVAWQTWRQATAAVPGATVTTASF